MTVSTSTASCSELASTPEPSGACVDISEKPARSLGAAAAFPVLLLLIAGLVFSGYLFVMGAHMVNSDDARGTIWIGGAACVFLLILVLFGSLTVVSPGQTIVLQFFGKYIGTLRRTGLVLVPPLTNRKKVSVKVHNFETHELKVNDSDGNPVNIAAIVVWQVADTARAVFAVEAYEDFIKAQAESALRHVASTHPYDEPGVGETSLRGSTDSVSAELAAEVAARVALAGLEVVEVRISSLAYAPEIAHAMLQRQQASAVISAREQIVEGAVSMARQALERLEQDEIVSLDDERKAQMVSNLLVVLCSDTNTQPVLNAGSLY